MPRLVTYNVRRCLGRDGKISPRRIAGILAGLEPDIVALQELDVGRKRSFGVDQAKAIADELRMQMHFHPALRVMEELYGDAILTPHRSRLIRAGALPGPPRLEPRGALWASVMLGGREWQFINTHLGLLPGERHAQLDALLGPDWLGNPAARDPLVLMGDLNATPSSRLYRRLADVLRDAQTLVRGHKPRATFPSRLPFLRIDHVFVSPSVKVQAVRAPRDALTRIASDHLPLVIDFSGTS